MSANGPFNFSNLDIKGPGPESKPLTHEGKPVDALYDEQASGTGKGTLPNAFMFRFLTTEEDSPELERENSLRKGATQKATATCYLWGCCFYNCCCCCFNYCAKWPGPWCGKEFMCNNRPICYEVNMRRDYWLRIIHFFCFALHTMWATLSWTAGAGKPMEVQLYRVKPSWQNTGRDGYSYEVVKSDWAPRIDTVTGLFFLLSAIAHGMWVFVSPWPWSRRLLWRMLDKALCWWRWLEYSLSASLMLVAIGMITALRQVDVMASIFMLNFTTMWCGMLTEVNSRPKIEKYDENGRPVYNYDYWQGQRENMTLAARWRNYSWRMLPHILGFFPYGAAWALVLGHFWSQIYDLPEDLRDRIPWFVAPAVTGTFVIFSSFTFVQWRYQWTAPKHYFRTEIWYCALSLLAKSYLGGLLYSNVLLAASFEEAISLADDNATLTNSTFGNFSMGR